MHIDLLQPTTKAWCVATAWDKRYENSDKFMHRRYKLIWPNILKVLFISARVLNPKEMM